MLADIISKPAEQPPEVPEKPYYCPERDANHATIDAAWRDRVAELLARERQLEAERLSDEELRFELKAKVAELQFTDEAIDRLKARERQLEADLAEAKQKLAFILPKYNAQATSHNERQMATLDRAEKAEARAARLEDDVRHAIGAFDVGYPREVINRLRDALENKP